MANHALYDDFVARLGEAVAETDTAFVNSILAEAADTISDMTGRDPLPDRLNSAVVLTAIAAYNKRGAEGESARSEGGISRSFVETLPEVMERLKNYPRKVGVVYASGHDTNNGG